MTNTDILIELIGNMEKNLEEYKEEISSDMIRTEKEISPENHNEKNRLSLYKTKIYEIGDNILDAIEKMDYRSVENEIKKIIEDIQSNIKKTKEEEFFLHYQHIIQKFKELVALIEGPTDKDSIKIINNEEPKDKTPIEKKNEV